ncbi:hypothetical protein P167DRAFT_425789 [Morchella conica CCBAS932]|uniref:Uncharacterized protein n=1 Tax=Morchella conica CCBAS932 TaxID=1392247 RepID=A0A3N4KXR9_9PEZI|nr:hypothetical protein P167DRAFT_425789 [Morchella conica CCBAS932]
MLFFLLPLFRKTIFLLPILPILLPCRSSSSLVFFFFFFLYPFFPPHYLFFSILFLSTKLSQKNLDGLFSPLSFPLVYYKSGNSHPPSYFFPPLVCFIFACMLLLLLLLAWMSRFNKE